MDALAVIAVIGGIALLAGLFGGITAKDLTIPPLPVAIRILSASMGVLLIAIVLWRASAASPSQGLQTGITPQPTTPPTIMPTRPTDVAIRSTDTPVPLNIVPPTTVPQITTQPTVVTSAVLIPKCGEQVFRVKFLPDETADVEFIFPEGYTYGFISSDPAQVEFSNGDSRLFSTQFVLVTKDFSSIKIKGIGMRTENGQKIVNSWGCIYGPNDGDVAEKTARQDYDVKVTHSNIAELYRVGPGSFEKLASNLQK